MRLIVVCLLLSGCGVVSFQDRNKSEHLDYTNPECVANDWHIYSCIDGTVCSKKPDIYCSTAVDGVACCPSNTTNGTVTEL